LPQARANGGWIASANRRVASGTMRKKALFIDRKFMQQVYGDRLFNQVLHLAFRFGGEPQDDIWVTQEGTSHRFL
jgi:hypothetical protein